MSIKDDAGRPRNVRRLPSSLEAFDLVGIDEVDSQKEIDNLLPNNRTSYALRHILYPVPAAYTSIFRMDSNSTSQHARVFEGVAKSQFFLKAVAFKSGKRVLTRF